MNQTVGTIAYIALIAGVFYFLWYRPQQAQQRRMRELMNDLQPGDRIMTAGGILGVVKDVEGELADIEIAPGVIVRFRKRAIVERIVEPADETVD